MPHLSRRQFNRAALFLGGTTLITSPSRLFGDHPNSPSSIWRMPEESEPHLRTWMAFVASHDIWSRRQIPEVQRNLAAIARTIAKYEPVMMLVRPQDRAIASELLDLKRHPTTHPIKLIDCPLNDLWIRDTGPSFVHDKNGQKAALNFNFNGWGEDQAHEHDALVADFVANRAGVPAIATDLVLEGGCFELDGRGTAIMTESCLLNDNRNPGLSKAEFEHAIKPLLGLEKIIWLRGIKGRDITDGHTDFYARFIRPGVVAVSRDTDPDSYDHRITRENISTLESATDAHGNALELVILDTPWDITSHFGTKDFAAGYVGYYVCNDAVIMQKFGDTKADSSSRSKLAAAFPDREIESVQIDGIASGGGSIHCATQQEPV